MIHSVICWDCSFRNFFHTIDGLVSQDFDRDQFELIYVEQRSRSYADSFNHSENLKSLWDRYQEVKDTIDIKVIYLDQPESIPYHLGITVNKALPICSGKIISVMDGDLLLPSDFLSQLQRYHGEEKVAIVNLARHMASKPVGVSYENWKGAEINYSKCLAECPSRDEIIPKTISNKGPLISAHRDYWDEVNGYDEHLLWSTGITRLGQDVTKRLEILTGVESTALPGKFCVHPWHPIGFRRDALTSQRMLEHHQSIISWTEEHQEYDWRKRLAITNMIYDTNKSFFDRAIFSDLSTPGQQDKKTTNLFNVLVGKVYKKIQEIKG